MEVWEAWAEVKACNNVIPEERMRLYDEAFLRSLGITRGNPENWASSGSLTYVPEKNWYVNFERRPDGTWRWVGGDAW